MYTVKFSILPDSSNPHGIVTDMKKYLDEGARYTAGPFSHRETAEQAVLGLLARPMVVNVTIEET